MQVLTSQRALWEAGAAGQKIIVPGEFNHLSGYLVGWDEASISLLACMKMPVPDDEEPRLVWNAVVFPRWQTTMIFTDGRLTNEPKNIQQLHDKLAGPNFSSNCKDRLNQHPHLP